MKVHLVGGAVRDALLGLPVRERDWVVVGARATELEALGYTRVGHDFPVFLHPSTKEEHALARTERKRGRGYHGFEVDADPAVTLEQDLLRRDLTVNAMALAADDAAALLAGDRGALDRVVDPYGGRRDLAARVLRGCGALAALLPEVDRLFGVPQPAQHHPEIDSGVHTLMVLEQAAALTDDLEVRFAALTHDLGKGTTPGEMLPKHHGHEQRGAKLVAALCERLKAPRALRELAELVAHHHLIAHRALELRPSTALELLEHLDAFRRPQRATQFFTACEADARGRTGREAAPYPQRARLEAAHAAARGVDARAVAAGCAAAGVTGEGIAAQLRAARVAAIAAAWGVASR